MPLVGVVLTGAIEFKPNEVIPVSGMLASNSLIAINLAYQNLDREFVKEMSQIESKYHMFLQNLLLAQLPS